jgi:hypothetical protein
MYERLYDVYSTLNYWLDRARPKEEIQRHFRDFGKRRFDEGIPMHEVIMFLMLIKRHLWLYLLEKHFFESSYELMKSLELNNRVVLFFDRAILAASMGYEDELIKYVESCKVQGLVRKFFNKRNRDASGPPCRPFGGHVRPAVIKRGRGALEWNGARTRDLQPGSR